MRCPTLLHIGHQALLDCPHFLAGTHTCMWDIMHQESFQSPDSKPQMYTFDPSKHMIMDNNKHKTNMETTIKKFPQDEMFTIHPGPCPGLLESLPRLLPN